MGFPAMCRRTPSGELASIAVLDAMTVVDTLSDLPREGGNYSKAEAEMYAFLEAYPGECVLPGDQPQFMLLLNGPGKTEAIRTIASLPALTGMGNTAHPGSDSISSSPLS